MGFVHARFGIVISVTWAPQEGGRRSNAPLGVNPSARSSPAQGALSRPGRRRYSCRLPPASHPEGAAALRSSRLQPVESEAKPASALPALASWPPQPAARRPPPAARRSPLLTVTVPPGGRLPRPLDARVSAGPPGARGHRGWAVAEPSAAVKEGRPAGWGMGDGGLPRAPAVS